MVSGQWSVFGRFCFVRVAAVGLIVAAGTRADDAKPESDAKAESKEKLPTWQPPKADEVKAQALAWLDGKKADAAARAKAEAIWSKLGSSPSEDELLTAVTQIFALGRRERGEAD